MQDLNEYLVHLADKLDNDGKLVCANAIDELIQSNSLIKVAQYVGVIGYVLKQNRAMGNCIRKKRASSNRAMQEIVLECLKEYQDGQDYHDTEWHSKYAQAITERPNQFNNIHLEILAQWGNNDQLQEHIQRVENADTLLRENGVKEDTFMKVLSDVEDLGGILRKESSSQRPFKLAAQPSPRSNWSRFWTPSEFSWKNPMSWLGRWQRGEDKDVMMEMDNILDGITNIGHLTQRMKTNIYRLKNQVAGYMVGSNTDLPDTDSPKVINTVADKINQLDPSNWNKNILALQQLKHLLSDSNVQNRYNAEHVKMAVSLVDDLLQGVNKVYDHIDSIQKNMLTARQRGPIKGRDSGLTDQGTKNPFGMTSPSEEFGVLEQVLSRLYENPFNEQTQHYAQRMHARLDDRLRYIQRPDDDNINQWLQNKPEDTGIPNPAIPESKPNGPAEEQVPGTSPGAANKTLSQDQLQRAVDILRKRFTNMDGDQIAAILNAINLIFKDQGQPDDRLDAITEALTQSGGQQPSKVPQSPAQSPVQAPSVQAPSPKAPVTKPKVETEPHSLAPSDFHMPDLESELDIEDEETDRDRRKAEMRMASVFDVIKIADTLDTIDPELGSLLDRFLEEKEDIMFPLPRFPSVGKIIKEKGVVSSKD